MECFLGDKYYFDGLRYIKYVFLLGLFGRRSNKLLEKLIVAHLVTKSPVCNTILTPGLRVYLEQANVHSVNFKTKTALTQRFESPESDGMNSLYTWHMAYSNDANDKKHMDRFLVTHASWTRVTKLWR